MALEHSGSDQPAIVGAALNDYTTGYLGGAGAMLALMRQATEAEAGTSAYLSRVPRCGSCRFRAWPLTRFHTRWIP